MRASITFYVEFKQSDICCFKDMTLSPLYTMSSKLVSQLFCNILYDQHLNRYSDRIIFVCNVVNSS